ncbi:hypothetical protein SAMN05216510_4127 [Pseudomonas coleopterorum]|nr:hypothetical protein SAMN05216510_4127 [Pseudomonas coleopterorum]
MIDHTTSIDIGQRFTGEPTQFFFLVKPGGQGLFHDPVFQKLQALGDFIDAFGQLEREVRSDRTVFCRSGHNYFPTYFYLLEAL